jgi:hypothetical protein
MNSFQSKSILLIVEEHNSYIQSYGVGNSSYIRIFEDDLQSIYVLMQQVTLDLIELCPKYSHKLLKVIDTGEVLKIDESRLNGMSMIDFVKDLKRIKI